MSEQLMQENETLKNQIIQQSNGVRQLMAQLEAYKNQLMDTINGMLHLRTNAMLIENHNKELQQMMEALKLQIEELKKPALQSSENAA